MKLTDSKSYTNFIEQCSGNASVLLKSNEGLTFSVVTEFGGNKTRYELGELSANSFRDRISSFVNRLEQVVDSITVQIESGQKVMKSLQYTPPKQANGMDTNPIESFLGDLPKNDRMLGAILQLNGDIKLESLKSDYKEKMQNLEFNNRLLADKLERAEKELKSNQEKYQEREKVFRRKLKAASTQIENFKSEERALGNINLVKDISKEAFGAFMLYKAADVDDDKKEEKYMTLAGILTGMQALPQKDEGSTSEPVSYISEHHDVKRKGIQIELFEYLNSLDANSFHFANLLIEFTCNESKQSLVHKYIIPLLNGTLKE